jgi:hypothetical protein
MAVRLARSLGMSIVIGPNAGMDHRRGAPCGKSLAAGMVVHGEGEFKGKCGAGKARSSRCRVSVAGQGPSRLRIDPRFPIV